jgi:hypothetical protein
MKLLYTLLFAFFISCSTEPEIKDCAGIENGAATIDDCGLCTGGTTDNIANYLKDCSGECGGDATEDCLGECNGLAVTDNCGTCDSDATNDCVQDCAGVEGGSAYLDDCGGCDANVNNDGYMDYCGVCDTDSTNNNTTCEQDCAGIWGGDSVLSGCDNACNSIKEFDNCGICDGDNTVCASLAGTYTPVWATLYDNAECSGDGMSGICTSDYDVMIEADCPMGWFPLISFFSDGALSATITVMANGTFTDPEGVEGTLVVSDDGTTITTSTPARCEESMYLTQSECEGAGYYWSDAEEQTIGYDISTGVMSMNMTDSGGCECNNDTSDCDAAEATENTSDCSAVGGEWEEGECMSIVWAR